MYRIGLIATLAWGALISGTAPAVAAEPRFVFELAIQQGFPIANVRKWIEMVRNVPRSTVRARSAGVTEDVGVKNVGTEKAPIYKVMGLLTADNRLRVAGKRFGLGDRARLLKWAEQIASGGLEAAGGARNLFGLTSKELVDAHKKLSVPVLSETKKLSAGDAVKKIGARIRLPIDVDRAAVRTLQTGPAVGEELQGLSAGTALAAVLRPLGLSLVLKRERRSREVRLAIVPARTTKESWPVGWATKISPRKAIPKLFDFLDVEITDIPLSDTLAAIQPRLKVPLLYDRNALAAEDVEPTEIKVTVPPGRSYYKRILDRALAQAKLKMVLRHDEANRPFLWVTTVRDPFKRRKR